MMNQQKLLKPWSLLACVAALGGCGGGSGSAPVPSKVDLSTSIAALQGPFDQPQPLQLTVTNSGQAAVLNLSVKASDTMLAVASDTCSGKALAAGASCTVSYSAKPTAAGQGSVGVTVQYSGDDGAGSKALSVPYKFDGSQWDTVPVWANQLGNASNTGYVPLVLEVGKFKLAWEQLPEFGDLRLIGITSDKDSVYFTVDWGLGAVYALSQGDGSRRWKQPLPTQYHWGTGRPAVADGVVLVQASGVHYVDALTIAASTGATLGTQGAETCGHIGVSSGPLVWEQSVYFWCANPFTTPYLGRTDLRSSVSGGIESSWYLPSSETLLDAAWGTAAADASYVYLWGALNRKLNVVDRATGKLLRQIDPGAGGGWAPVLGEASAHAFMGTGDTLSKLDLNQGTVVWKVAGYSGQAAYANQTVYVPSSDGLALNALDASTGSRQWTWTAPAAIVSNLVVTKSHVFASTESNTYAINLASHAVDWVYPAGGSTLLLTNTGKLIIADAKAKLTAISLR